MSTLTPKRSEVAMVTVKHGPIFFGVPDDPAVEIPAHTVVRMTGAIEEGGFYAPSTTDLRTHKIAMVLKDDVITHGTVHTEAVSPAAPTDPIIFTLNGCKKEHAICGICLGTGEYQAVFLGKVPGEPLVVFNRYDSATGIVTRLRYANEGIMKVLWDEAGVPANGDPFTLSAVTDGAVAISTHPFDIIIGQYRGQEEGTDGVKYILLQLTPSQW